MRGGHSLSVSGLNSPGPAWADEGDQRQPRSSPGLRLPGRRRRCRQRRRNCEREAASQMCGRWSAGAAGFAGSRLGLSSRGRVRERRPLDRTENCLQHPVMGRRGEEHEKEPACVRLNHCAAWQTRAVWRATCTSPETKVELPLWLGGEESACRRRRLGFDP